MSERRRRHFAFARLLSSAVISQGLLSAASFAVGLILIRGTTDLQYGYYILGLNALLLLVSLQNALFNPPLAIRLNRLDPRARGNLVGGLYREQRRILSAAGAMTIVLVLPLWYTQTLNAQSGLLVLVTVGAALAILHREYFRMVLLAYRRPHDVLRSDVFHVVLMVAGGLIATLTVAPAATAILTLGLAAVASGILLLKTLRRHEPWDSRGSPGILREIAPLAAWSTAGAAVHWAFTQGFIYLAAGTLDIAAVAALAATRLLLMPVNLLSTGIGSLMLPVASGWLHQHGTQLVWRRLRLLALALATSAAFYFAILWFARDWIFAVVLRKQIAQSDELLMFWGAIFVVMAARDQLIYLLAAKGRFRALTLLTLACASVSLTASYWGMLRFGVVGALLGVLIGEVISVTGVVILSSRKAPDPVAALA